MRMRPPMRAVSCACGLVASAGAWGQPTLAALNRGPSSSTIPSGDDSTVLTFAFPREVVNPAVTDIPSGTLDGTAGPNSSITVQTTGGGGFRNRSRATIGESSQVNVNAAIRLVGNTNANGVAANSFVFIGRSVDIGTGVGQIGNTIVSLLAFIGTHTEGSSFFQIPFAAYPALDTNADVSEPDLNEGVNVPAVQFWAADPDGNGPLSPNSYRFNASFDIALFAIDTGGSADPDVVTEFMYLGRSGVTAYPTRAALDGGPGIVYALRVTASRQLVDDLTVLTIADTDLATLSAFTSLRVANNSSGAGAQSLGAFLGSLAESRSVSGVSLGASGMEGFQRQLVLTLNQPVVNTSDIAALRSKFIGFTSGASGGMAYAFDGGVPSSAVHVRLVCPGDVNGDRVVDFLDLSAVLAAYGQPVEPGGFGDLNGDNVVDFLDLNLVLAFFGAPC